jgi:hypothetical protein
LAAFVDSTGESWPSAAGRRANLRVCAGGYFANVNE